MHVNQLINVRGPFFGGHVAGQCVLTVCLQLTCPVMKERPKKRARAKAGSGGTAAGGDDERGALLYQPLALFFC